MNPHLNPDQIYTLLDRPEGDRIAQEHLLACAPCRAEVASLRDSLTNFRLAATNLSLRHTPTRLLDPREWRDPGRVQFDFSPNGD